MNVATSLRARWFRRALRAGVAGLTSFASAVSFATPLVQVDANTYKTEHCLFVIDSTVTWSSPTTAYNDLYAPGTGPVYFPKLAGYFSTLTSLFPGNYFSVCYIANTGASNVPNYINRTYKGTGISNGAGSSGIGAGSGVTPGTYDAVDMCRYNLPGGNIISPALAVFDHEIGHAWGAQIFYTLNPPMLANGHWLPNSTVDCQLGSGTSTDGYVTVNKIYGDPVSGFRWQKVDNARSNDTAVFSEQTLYLMGVSPSFPTSYVLNAPVFNADHTMSAASVDTFDHAAAVNSYGVRNPDYKTAPKQFKLGFIYIARDLAEVNSVYQIVEQSIGSFCNDESLSGGAFRSQTPFLCDARYRASVDALLADLDGNRTPSISIPSPYVSSTDGTATVAFTASDPDGSAPAVSLVPSSPHASVAAGSVTMSGLPDGVHFFTLKAADGAGKKAFEQFVVEVHRPSSSTTITASPLTQTATAGATATFTVAATGSPTSLKYQWYRQAAKTSTWSALASGGAYSGANSSSLTVATTPAMDGDQFLCLASNATGAATSTPASLVVNETTPLIASEASDQHVTVGASTYFRVTAGGTNTHGYYYYQWQRLPAGGSTWTDLATGGTYGGTDNSQLSISSATLTMSGDQFRCLASNTAGATIAAAATLHVGLAPQITSQPLPITASAGQTVSFTVTASGTGPLTYQWSKYGAPVGNAATLTLTNVQSADAAVYGVIVTNAYGLAYSNNVGLTVTAPVGTLAIFDTQPASQTVTAGATVTFTATASGAPAPTYHWFKDGVAINGATTATLSLANVLTSSAGNYTVIATNSAGSVTSAIATLTVKPAPTPPAITTQPQGLATTAGQNVSFFVTATGSAPLNYQWRKNNVAIAGATSATLSLSNVQSADAADYSVIVTNAVTSVTSAAATLSVVAAPTAPGIVTQPAATHAAVGQQSSLNVVASGTAPFTYQWKKNSVAIAGATAASFDFASVQLSDAGDYSVVVSNSVGSVTSAPATLTVSLPVVAPSILANPPSASIATGQSVTFSVSATGSAPFTYQWLKDGAVIGGASTATLSLSNVQVSAAGDYAVTVSNAAGAATSAPAHLTVTPQLTPPTILTQPSSVTLAAGAMASFTVVANAATTFAWQFNGAIIPGQTAPTLTITNVQPSHSGAYSVSVSNASGSITSSDASLYVTVVNVTGSYFGFFGPDRESGEFALVAQRDGSISLLARLPGSAKPVLVSAIALQPDGSFSVGSAADALVSASVNASRVFGGVISGRLDGTSLMLSIPSRGLSGDAPRTSTAVSLAGRAGLHRSLPLGEAAGEIFVLVGEGGEAFLLEMGATTSRSGLGTLSASGGLQVSVGAGSVAATTYAMTFDDAGFKGTAISSSGTIALLPAASAPGKQRLINLSSRGFAGTDDKTMIAGFVISGNEPKDVLVRVVGPTLSALGVTGALADPRLKVFHSGATVLENDDWDAAHSDIAVTTNRLGGSPLPFGSRDAAVLAHLSPGTYSVQASPGSGSAGVAIIEVYDAGTTDSTAPKVVNISTRAEVGRGDDVLIAGFVIAGDAPKQVLLRAVGPALSKHGVSGALADPLLRVFKNSALLKENDNWSSGPDAALIAATAAAIGAAPLDAGSKDATLLLYLEPGVYSVHVRGVADTTGVALVEVYEVTD